MENDYLTGLLSRKSFDRIFTDLLQKSASTEQPFSVAIMDVDRFKKFNDKFGHLFGDEILKYVAASLSCKLEEGCHIFRYGGDEFVVLFPGKTSQDIGLSMAACVRHTKDHPFLFKDKFFNVGISCGIASYPDDAKTMDGIIKKADEALYLSKRTGRNRITLAGNIRRIKIKNLSIMALIVLVVFWSGFFVYGYFLKGNIGNTLGRIRNIRVVTRSRNPDTIILKSGAIFKGRIIDDIGDKIILELDVVQGTGRATFDKEEIARIRHGKTGDEGRQP
ncbi:MAG: GGDEF domain-containing protein [Candidatus Omnitrophota bacterium]